MNPHRHDKPVEQADPLFNHPEMPDRQGIEASRINCQSFFGSHPENVNSATRDVSIYIREG